MCMEDVRIARRCVTVESVVNVDNVSTKPILGANNKRVAVVFSGLGGGNSFVTMRSNAAVGSGMALPFFGSQLSYNIWQHGSMPMVSWYGSNDGAAVTMVIVETILQED
jgi:hypothetical protein